MKILVTGSSGMIGTRLCQSLDKSQYIGIDRVKNIWDRDVNSQTIRADLCSKKWYDLIPVGVDTIIHLAANSRVKSAIADPAEFLNNIESLFYVLEFARLRKIKKIIFSSSKEIYSKNSTKKHRENSAKIGQSQNPYAASKIAGESLISSYQECYSVDYIILRFSNVYGPYDVTDRVIPLYIRNIISKKNLYLFGANKKLDFIYLDDVIDGILLSLSTFEKNKNQVFNIASGRGTSLAVLSSKIQRWFYLSYLGRNLSN